MIGDRWAHSHFAGDFRRNEEGVVERVPLGRVLSPTEGVMSWNFDAWVRGMFRGRLQGLRQL